MPVSQSAGLLRLVVLVALTGLFHACAAKGPKTVHHPDLIPADVAGIPNLVERETWSVDLIEVGPWYNRMPGTDVSSSAGRRHLVATANIVNKSAEPLSVEYEAGYISFDEAALGDAIPEGEFTMRDRTGMPSGATLATIEPGSYKNMFGLRGTGLFGEGYEDQMLHLTLVLRVGDEHIVLRRSGKVIAAM